MAMFAFFVAAVPTAAFAWSNAGHMASGAIAYDRLGARNPAALRAVLAIMAHHPDAARFKASLGTLTGTARDRAMFEWMARWPDDIRPTAWNHPEWHYQTHVATGWTWFPYVAGDAAKAFDRSVAIAFDPKQPAGERAIALCWLFHLTGDIQQPLHAGHRMSWRWMLTDRLGTIAYVRPNQGDQPLELHQYWDHAAENANVDARLGDTAAAAELARRAERIPRVPPDRTGALPPHDRFTAWTDESRVLARTFAYRGATLEAAKDRATAPVLGAVANARAQALATIRIAMAGDRLATLLSALR